MEMRKKAQGRTFWIVITAIVALVVLVVLLLIFTGKTGMLEKGLMSCEGKGGVCVEKICPEGATKTTVFSGCPTEKKICCITAKKREGESCETNADCLSNECTDKRCTGIS